MAGRSREPGDEVRKARTAVRWTPTEMRRIKEAKERMHLQYEVDVVRNLTLKQLDLEARLKDRSDDLERVAEILNVSIEDLILDLAFRQLDLISSALEKDVAE